MRHESCKITMGHGNFLNLKGQHNCLLEWGLNTGTSSEGPLYNDIKSITYYYLMAVRQLHALQGDCIWYQG